MERLIFGILRFTQFLFSSQSTRRSTPSCARALPSLNMLFLTNEPAKKAEINILTARDTTGPGY